MNDPLARLTAALADRYRIEREIGAGGMATVYLAEDLRHQRRVAIKVLRPELAAVIGADRFLSEIKTTANLQHPHILPLFDSGAADSFLFYVMPFIDGESLRERLTREKQLPIADAVRIACEAGDALDYAHRHGIIHRDIKPENILLHDGRALVADFGIALAASNAGGGRMTETGMSLGTPSYMSPEQAMGERDITARSDVYALGAMTYEMLVGEPPFIGGTVQNVVAKVLTEKPEPPSKLRETVPDEVEDAVLVALAKLPADRWPTAAAFVAALRGTAGAARPSTVTRARVAAPARWSARSPLPWVAALVLALLTGAWGWWRNGPPASAAVMRFELQPAPGTRIAVPVQGVATQVALSPDGRQTVFSGTTPSGGWMFYVRSLEQLTARPLAGTEGAFNPEYSPDGRWLAFRSSDGKLRKVALDGSDLTTICAIDNSGAIGGGMTWISDREIVFARGNYSDGPGLWRVSSDGGTPAQFSHLDSATHERLQLSPRAADGGRLVFYASTIASNADLTLAVIETATGRLTILTGLRGVRPLGLVSGYLVYVRGDGALMAAPFNERKREAGAPIQVGDSIAVPASAWDTPAALSTTGSLLFQRGGIAGQLVSVNAHGQASVLVDSVQTYLHPRFSPDGRRIAVEVQGAAGADIWIADPQEHTAVRLTREGYNNRPEWTPDGTRVMYPSSREPANALWWQPADGSANAEVLLHVSDPIREGVPTPDGRSVLYRIDTPGNNRDIYMAPIAGERTPAPVLANINDDKEPRVSPDGRWLAYVSNESGREEVYVRALAGGSGRVPVSVGGAGEPLWSRDGRRLFYRQNAKLMAANVTTSPSLAITGRTMLFEGPYATDLYHPNYDVGPDGSSFLMVRPAEENRHLVVAVNWIQELRQRTGGR